jgi:glycosyltransferase involved in cell wall biosynthesis
MCVFVGSYNNEKNYRYEYNLISILNQNYTNYRVIIYDDGSFDQTGKLIQ